MKNPAEAGFNSLEICRGDLGINYDPAATTRLLGKLII